MAKGDGTQRRKAKAEKLTIKDQAKALNYLPRFFKLIWKTSPKLAFTTLILRIFKAIIPLITLYIGKLIIDEIVGLINSETAFELISENTKHLWILVGIELGLTVFSEILSRIITLTDNLLGDLVANYTSVQLISHASKLDLEQFEDATFYDKLERARQQTSGRVILMSQVLSQGQDIITLITLAIGLVAFNGWLILILILALVPAFLGETHFNERAYSLSLNWTPQRRELDYLRYIGASDFSAKELKVFGLSDFLANRFKFLSDNYYNENKSLTQKRAFWGSIFSVIGTASYYGAYVLIVSQTILKVISLGDLTFLAGSFERLRSMLQQIMGRFSSIAQSALYLKDLFEFLELEPLIPVTKTQREVPNPIKEGFVFENVGFKYQNQERYAIKNLSFTLHKGEKLALVGENGAGKTTLVKLLARLYDPTEGRILLDGYDLKEYNPTQLRNLIGVIFQDFVKFELTVSENIAVGSINERENLPLITDAATKSLANTVIEKLPEKYSQMLGRKFTGGVSLSGGEWQKVALGRAYMRDAQLYILDEPTAALDARAEHEVFERFAELIERKTAVLISHRFSTVRMADRILVLQNGGVLEIGSHDELLAKNGKYAELFNLQAEGYK
ncbi:ABC-type multidrug transport system, ATPase and permease component [Bernardetia litoralis DSM 6794]|uniref:ABC-type multidrug transport system, ATPase and permease component n=1 Tax=Bernardetia litoralis (strain ATCC 23117 / DSM 6794 / NBRC 15988 / NCIMB 1366 / Fx l1 / Sio-4) TaxID=880071 RepID=I4AG26_BERLS|nr:ABC transporter ATP-binding protein [Bernardetia litoralis]AFM02911.1 ABC-type multidrug transport system, ATPase and permease component [Bernardetia litoralis DSM 6794]